MRLIGCFSTAPAVGRSVTSRRAFSGSFQHHIKGGWTVGAGIEAAITDNLAARLEYLYLKLQDTVCTSQNACGLDPRPGSFPDDTVKFSTNMIRLGLTYKFR